MTIFLSFQINFITYFEYAGLMQRKNILGKLLLPESSQNSLVVFDLDSTLYNVSPRNRHILRQFIKDPYFIKRHSEISGLSRVDIQPTDWGLQQAIQRAGIVLSPPLIKDLKEFWRKSFFSSEHLHHDEPYTGAVQYVNRLSNLGHHILYLTGRDKENMHSGTIASFIQHSFPFKADSQLIMKPKKGALDEDYKAEELNKLISHFDTVTFFENEPVIINRVYKRLPEVKIIWLDSTHSGRELPPQDILRIEPDYSLDE